MGAGDSGLSSKEPDQLQVNRSRKGLSDAEDRLLPALAGYLGALERELIPADGPRKKRMKVHLKVETVDADADSSSEEGNVAEAVPRSSDLAVDAIPRLMQKIRVLQGTRVLANNSDEQ